MANYNYTALGVLGTSGGDTAIKARVGLGLLNKLLVYGASGVMLAQDPEFPLVVLPALDKSFVCWIHNYSVNGSQQYRPASATDWRGLEASTDLDQTVVADVVDPTFTASSPSPILTAWCAAYGGTSNQSGGM